jgi:hypothetical protein
MKAFARTHVMMQRRRILVELSCKTIENMEKALDKSSSAFSILAEL